MLYDDIGSYKRHRYFKKTNFLVYCLPLVVVTVDVAAVAIVDVTAVVVVVASPFRAKLIPNGMPKAAAAKTTMMIPEIIHNNRCLFFLFTLDSSFDTDGRIVSVSLLELLKD